MERTDLLKRPFKNLHEMVLKYLLLANYNLALKKLFDNPVFFFLKVQLEFFFHFLSKHSWLTYLHWREKESPMHYKNDTIIKKTSRLSSWFCHLKMVLRSSVDGEAQNSFATRLSPGLREYIPRNRDVVVRMLLPIKFLPSALF